MMRNKDSFKMAQLMENMGINRKKTVPEESLKLGLAPWVGENPVVLILGTLPGDKSIQSGLYYDNQTNRFWEIMHTLFGGSLNDKNKEFLFEHKIALWDCFKSAKRKGSADKNIEKGSETPNDIYSFLNMYPTIKTIILNGTTKHPHKGFSTISAFNMYFKELYKDYNIIPLHQTSQGNEKYGITLQEKIEEWKKLKEIVNAQP